MPEALFPPDLTRVKPQRGVTDGLTTLGTVGDGLTAVAVSDWPSDFYGCSLLIDDCVAAV